jgi:hypothetical protein
MEGRTPFSFLHAVLFIALAMQWADVAPAQTGPRTPNELAKAGGMYFSQRGGYEDAIYGARRSYRTEERRAKPRLNSSQRAAVRRTPSNQQEGSHVR